MTTGHLIADANLTFLGNVNLGHLENARRKFVANRDIVFLSSELGIEFLILAQVVYDGGTNHVVLVRIVCPLAQVKGIVFKFCKTLGSELCTLCNLLVANEVFHALRSLAFGEYEKLVDENLLEF